MNNQDSFRRITTISTIIAGVLILAATITLSMAVDFNVEFLDNPAGLITAGLDAGAAGLIRWGSILELLGYFLFLIPLTLYFWTWLKPENPTMVTLFTVLGLGSIVIGVVETTIRASFWPPLMIAYPQATEAQREVLQIIFNAVTAFSIENLYATNSILGGLWWLGIGLVLRAQRRILGSATALMGLAVLGAGVGWLLRIEPLARLEVVYFFQPIWAIWLGIVIWRGSEEDEALEAVTAF